MLSVAEAESSDFIAKAFATELGIIKEEDRETEVRRLSLNIVASSCFRP